MILKWLAKKISEHIELEEMQELEDLYVYVEELEAKLNLLRTEIWEYVDGTLQPLSRRIGQRLRRNETQELNTEGTMKKGGLMSSEEYKKYHGTTNKT